MALMLAISLSLRFLESLIPISYFMVPGLKLGLANIVSVVMLYKFKFSESFLVLVLRVLISSMFGLGISSMIYSLSGGILSLVLMNFFKNLKSLKLSITGISVLGSIFFNIGQLIVASLILKNFLVFTYFTFMGISSILTGLFVGYLSKSIVENKNIWKIMK